MVHDITGDLVVWYSKWPCIGWPRLSLQSDMFITRTVVANNEHRKIFSILILSAYQHIAFQIRLFSSDFPTKLCTNLSPIHSTCPSPNHPPSFHHPHNISQAVQVTNILKWYHRLHSPPPSYLLHPNTFGYVTTNDAKMNNFWQ